jgi:hypothetical protein
MRYVNRMEGREKGSRDGYELMRHELELLVSETVYPHPYP